MTDEALDEGLLYYSYYSLCGPHNDTTNNVACADSDQPGYLPSLISLRRRSEDSFGV